MTTEGVCFCFLLSFSQMLQDALSQYDTQWVRHWTRIVSAEGNCNTLVICLLTYNLQTYSHMNFFNSGNNLQTENQNYFLNVLNLQTYRSKTICRRMLSSESDIMVLASVMERLFNRFLNKYCQQVAQTVIILINIGTFKDLLYLQIINLTTRNHGNC